jgi:hypothetical protein
MTTARFGRAARLPLALTTISLLFLTACALDRESTVRAQLDTWVVLGETVFFKSNRICTAGLFATGASSILSGAKKVRSVDRGVRVVGQGDTVAFDIPNLSPADVQSEVDATTRPVSLVILTSGLEAKDCLTDDLQEEFTRALFAKDAVLIFDPGSRAVALFDRAQKQVFYTRADP